MIYEIPNHQIAFDLSKIANISWKERVPAKNVSVWEYLSGYRSSSEERPRVRISPEKWYAVDFEYDTDKEAKKVYDDLVKAWKGE